MMQIKRCEPHSLPGKLMGYAAYGKYDPKIEKWVSYEMMKLPNNTHGEKNDRTN